MIRSALLLIRTSLLQVLFLAGTLTVLVNVLSTQPGGEGGDGWPGMPSLAPVPAAAAPVGNAAAALRVPLFDPEHRPETVAGSIDDLRLGPAPPPPPAAAVAINGVLVSGRIRRAMLTVAGGPATWTDVGADVGGWHVAAVDAEGALLERDGQTLALKMADRLRNRAKARSDQSPEPPTPEAAAGPANPPGGDNGAAPPSGAPDPLAPPDGGPDTPHP